MTLESPKDDQEVPAVQDVDPYNAHLARTFIPIVAHRLTVQETVRQSVQERQSDRSFTTPPMVAWPAAGATPINEFNTEGYISCAFPTLFPIGSADFVAP